MKNKTILLLIIVFLFLVPAVHAGSVITVTEFVNANGSIGIYLRNELGVTIYTDSIKNDRSSLTYTVNGTNVTINADKSDSEIPRDFTKFVVLNKEWPSSGYYNVDITFRDAGGGLYPKDTYVLFAKPPLALLSESITPTKVLSNTSKLTYTAKIQASGENSVSSINFDLVKNPKYFIISDSKIPGALSKGATADIIITFEKDGQAMPDTVVYTTLFIPMRFTYNTMGFEGSQIFNTSFVMFNTLTTSGQFPVMEARIAVPAETVQPGQEVSIPVYVWNSNVGGNNACNVTLTLTSNSTDVAIPSNIIPIDGDFKGRIEEMPDPTATFTADISSSAKSGDYKLSLNILYTDCSWKNEEYTVKTATLSVSKSGGTIIKDEPIVEPPVDTTPREPIVNITSVPSEKSQGIAGIFVTVVAIIGVLVIFGLIYFLEFRSRTVY
ncbi:TPA: hypothetical protein H1012_04105 [archaeon]|nr:hypothetical protein [Candidatus Naiadarchaeales archaeon SRR2090159.bin1288]